MSQAAPLILLHPDDNVLVCGRHVAEGEALFVDGLSLIVTSHVDVGHKVARFDLKAGDKVIKYGAPIGSMTGNVSRGEHIHLHNMQSDYIKSHTREVSGE